MRSELVVTGPITTAEALAMFDAASAVSIDEMIGQWRGTGLQTGHPMDGLLERYGWYGKSFVDADTVHPLLFGTEGVRLVAIDPRWIPI